MPLTKNWLYSKKIYPLVVAMLSEFSPLAPYHVIQFLFPGLRQTPFSLFTAIFFNFKQSFPLYTQKIAAYIFFYFVRCIHTRIHTGTRYKFLGWLSRVFPINPLNFRSVLEKKTRLFTFAREIQFISALIAVFVWKFNLSKMTFGFTKNCEVRSRNIFACTQPRVNKKLSKYPRLTHENYQWTLF